MLPISAVTQSNLSDETQIEVAQLLQDHSDLFVDAAHRGEFCGSNERGCQTPLQRRMKNFHFQAIGRNSFLSEDVAQSAGTALRVVMEQIQLATGIRLHVDPPIVDQQYLLLVFVNEDVYRSDPETFLKSVLVLSIFDGMLDRREFFDNFLESPIECVVLTPRYSDGVIRESQIFIKVDISPDNMSRCVAEEVFNSFGVGDGENLGYDSIFDWPMSRLEDGTLRTDFSPLHLAFLRRLYSDDMKPNQSRAETRALVTAN